MDEVKALLGFAEALIHKETGTYCSELQRLILLSSLQEERRTYDQLAEASGYSNSYVKQDVAPKLWQLLSHILRQKVSKSNVRTLLSKGMGDPSLAHLMPIVKPPPPPAEAPLNSPPASITAAFPPTEVQPLTTANILLVDDQPKNLRLLSDLLEEQGYEVQQAINGTVALQAITLDLPDLILLDINMPDMDGYTVCQTLKAESTTRDVPVIFVSAVDEAWDKVKAFSVGGVDYITKPFKVVEVLARVENQLKIAQLQQALRTQNAQLQQAIQELQRLAAIDELTQVASRRRFDQYLLTTWQQAVQTQAWLTLMLCQVDHFNFDSDGTNAQRGDQCLCQIAQVIKQTVQGASDLVCRYGTVIFAIILPQHTAAQGTQVAQRLLQKVQTLQMTAEEPEIEHPRITLSIGMTTRQGNPDVGLEALLEVCDRRLQHAKSQGGNCIIAS